MIILARPSALCLGFKLGLIFSAKVLFGAKIAVSLGIRSPVCAHVEESFSSGFFGADELD